MKTIKKRMYVTTFPVEAVELLYRMVYGVSDKSTEIGQKNNKLQAIAAVFIFTKFTVSKYKKVMFITELAIQKQSNFQQDIKMKEKICMYPLCVNYDPKAKKYCCNGCSWDHHDYIEIHGKDTMTEMLSCLEATEKIVPSNIGVKRVWFRALVNLREAVRLQKENDNS